MIPIIYKGRNVDFTTLAEFPEDSITQRYLQEQLKYMFLRNERRSTQWNAKILKVLWDFNSSLFLTYIETFNLKVLRKFRNENYDVIVNVIKEYSEILPRVLDVVRNPRNYKLQLLYAIQNKNSDIDFVLDLITPETIVHVDEVNWNPLIYCLRYRTNSRWIPVAKELITPETKTQVDLYGWNPLMYCLKYCTNSRWILVAKELITPETVKTAGASKLIRVLRAHRDSRWHSLIDLIKEVS